jgi:transglutaminase-like putative cysteine protease
MRSRFIVFLILTPFLSLGQAEEIYQKFKARYPDETAIFFERGEEITFDLVADTLQITAKVTEDLLHLKENSSNFVNNRVYGSHFVGVRDIEGKTLVAQGSKYKPVRVENMARKDDHDAGIFYDDSYYYALSFPSLAPKARTQLNYTEVYRDPHLTGGYTFVSYLPVATSTYTAKVHRSVDFRFRVFNDPGSIRYRKETRGDYTTHTWTYVDAPKIRIEARSPNARYFVPHIVAYAAGYTASSGYKKLLASPEDLFSWYMGFLDRTDQTPSDDLKNTVARITKGALTEEEKVKRVFYWVQDNIRYIAFEEGMRGFVPHGCTYVFEKRYGDCKDMASIIVGMLRAAGITAYTTWIGSRDIPYRYSDLPTPMVDNHMIATYIDRKGDYIFLDATGNYTAYGLPTDMIQGKEALIAISDSKFEIREVPVVRGENNLLEDVSTLTLRDNAAVSEGTLRLTGYPKIDNTYSLVRANPEESRKHVLKLVERGTNKYFLDTYEVQNLDSRELPLMIHYTVRLEDYVRTAGDEIYVNLNLEKKFNNAVIENRTSPMTQDYRFVAKHSVALVIPEGYEVSFLPEGVQAKSPELNYTIGYRKEAGKVILDQQFELNFLLLPPDRFEAWNKAVTDLSRQYRESVILRKKS